MFTFQFYWCRLRRELFICAYMLSSRVSRVLLVCHPAGAASFQSEGQHSPTDSSLLCLFRRTTDQMIIASTAKPTAPPTVPPTIARTGTEFPSGPEDGVFDDDGVVCEAVDAVTEEVPAVTKH